MDWRHRKDKEYDCHIKDIRQQLTEQLKCLDFRLETHVLMLSELQDFYKRRAEVESDYAHSMEKLVKQTMTKHRNDKQKRESWPDYSTYTVWQTLLSTTHKLGSDHGTMGVLYNGQMALQMSQLSEYIQRVYKRCRELIIFSHEELIRVMTELQASLKTYQKYHGEFVQAEAKLKTVEDQRTRLDQSTDRPTAMLRRKLRNLEKQIEKKQLKHLEANLKAVKARNEYLLCLEAANSSVQTYFTDNINELIDTIDFGYHDVLSHTMQLHTSAEDCYLSSRKGCLDLLNQQVRGLNQAMDKQSFIERYNGPFALPTKFAFQAHQGDKVCQLSVEETVQDDILDRLGAIQERLRSLMAESEEASKVIENTGATYLGHVRGKNINMAALFQDGVVESQMSALDQVKNQSEKVEAEEIYYTKFREYHKTSNLIARLQAKYRYMEKALMHSDSHLVLQNLRSSSFSSLARRRKEISRVPTIIRPKLFGGNMEEYIRVTGEDIPLIIRSSVRIINLYGMHHQGIFRIPGSQKEINDFRNQFERGRDPFAEKMDGKDMDSVAGVLKLYFRELQDPLFPASLFDDLVSFISQRSFTEPSEIARSIYDIRHLLMSSLKQSIIVVMRYFFSFLNHLSEFSDENMMDAFNLAICLGPTLLPVPSSHDLVQYQGHVTELVKNIIIYEEDIFPRSTDGPAYEKFIIQVNYGIKAGSRITLFEDDDLGDDIGSGDEIVAKEALALYDFQARTDRELSFKKGDSITVFEKVSNDWWEAAINDQEGLIPDKYITVPTQDVPGNTKPAHNNQNNLNAGESSQPIREISPAKDCMDNVAQSTEQLSNGPCSPQPGSASSHRSSLYFCTSSGPSPELSTIICKSQENCEDIVRPTVVMTSLHESDKGKTTEQLKSDIDAALADVFSGIEFLSGTSRHHELCAIVSEPGVRHRPDLVSDLPLASVPSGIQKSVPLGATAKGNSSNAIDFRTSQINGSAAESKPVNIYENLAVANKTKSRTMPSTPQNQNQNLGQKRSNTPETCRRTKAFTVTPVTRTNRHSFASTSDNTQPPVLPGLRSRSTGQETEIWVSKRSVSPGMSVSRHRPVSRTEPQAAAKDFVFARSAEKSSGHLRTAPVQSHVAGSVPVLSKVAPSRTPQQRHSEQNLRSPEAKLSDTIEDVRPSFI